MSSLGSNLTETIKDGVLRYVENVRAGKLDVLDMFLVGWVVISIVSIVLTSWVTNILTKRRQAAIDSGEMHVSRQQSSKGAESCEWINSTVAWLYMHQSQSPEFIHCWLKALNDQTKKQGSSVQVTFDRVKPGSLPPKITNMKSDAGPRDILTISCYLEASNLAFVIFATQQTSASVKLSTCEVSIEKLAGQVQCKVACITEEVQVTAIFDGKPELKLTLKPQNAAMDDLVDLKIVEDIVRSAITNAMTTYTLSAKNLPKDVAMMSTNYHTTSSFQPVANMTRRPLMTSQGIPPKPPRAHERRLLVKVIKANGLAGGNELSCGNPYCLIEMDLPEQKHKTANVRNTANPFWDEHFLFDLNNNTNVIKFTVMDKDKPPQDQYLGGAIVSLESLRRNPSTRQIIPLQGKNDQDGRVSGSITLEFLFMEPAEAQVAANQMYPQPSPLRSKYPEAPSKITKANVNDQYRRSRSVSPARDRVMNSNDHLRPPDVNDGLLSVSDKEPYAPRSRTPMKKSTLIIQGVSRDDEQTPVDETPSPSPSPTPTPTPTSSFRKARGTSPNRSKRRFFSFGKKDKERDKRRHSSHSDLSSDKTHTMPSHQRDTLQVPGNRSGRSSSAGDLHANHKVDNRSDTSSIRSTGSQLSYTPNDYSTLVIETLENGHVKHYLIPATLARTGKYEVRGTKLHVFNDHCFVATHFTSNVTCEACNKSLTRRMGKQGYQCRDCKIVVHKHCHFKADAHCPNSRVSSMEMLDYIPPPTPRRRSLSLPRMPLRSRSRSRERRNVQREESSIVTDDSFDVQNSSKTSAPSQSLNVSEPSQSVATSPSEPSLPTSDVSSPTEPDHTTLDTTNPFMYDESMAPPQFNPFATVIDDDPIDVTAELNQAYQYSNMQSPEIDDMPSPIATYFASSNDASDHYLDSQSPSLLQPTGHILESQDMSYYRE